MGNYTSNKIEPESSNNRKFILGIIDVQNDFCKGGSLAITDADDIVAPINKMRFTYINEMHTFVTQDFHPPNHMSFHTTHGKDAFSKIDLKIKINGDELNVTQDLWPKHCVKDTDGADFHPDLIVTSRDIRIQKGTIADIESYSAFGDEFKNKYENTKLNKILKEKKITDIVLTGLATDYCVYYTALDALRCGYHVHLVLSCTKGVKPETTKKALDDMTQKGVFMYDSVDDFYDYYKSIRK
jgi:nicotinamidase/pyrazinamidase